MILEDFRMNYEAGNCPCDSYHLELMVTTFMFMWQLSNNKTMYSSLTWATESESELLYLPM